MFDKLEILGLIVLLLLAFYFTISWSAGGSKKPEALTYIKKYLFGVKVLIIFIAIVSLILWLIL